MKKPDKRTLGRHEGAPADRAVESESNDPATIFKGETATLAALLRIVQMARRVLDIYSPELDPALFGQSAIVDALSQFARRAANSQLRILSHSNSRLVRDRHRLLPLIQRLDSKIHVRQVPENYAADQHSFVIADTRAYWMIADCQVLEGQANTADPVQLERLRERFDSLWARSVVDPNIRQLRI